MFEGYTVREAAGCFWIVHVEQSDDVYEAPVSVNETAARAFVLLKECGSVDAAAEVMASEYGVDKAVIEEDINSFISGMNTR
ncbi:MAG: PqqD family protein [Eubacterium sp.]|nr:PqqD family protein [Eubacterium sp.]